MRKLVILAAVAALYADTLEMKDGRRLSGRVLLFDGQQVRMSMADKIEAFNVTDVSGIRFGDETTGTPTAANPKPAAGALPAGTVVAVKTIDAIDSRKADPGQTFRANLDEPIVVNGVTIAATGADAMLKVVEAKDAGKLSGGAQLTVALASVKIGGQMVEVNSENLTSNSAGKGKGTATKAGVGAGAGAVIGGILGGKRGALIGAGAGAGAGTAVAMATKGPRVAIPSETRLSFTIQ